MSETTIRKHPLHREGTSQKQRWLEELGAQYVMVDETSLKDMLAFARDYAKSLNYYDLNNENRSTGKWENFFDNDIQMGKNISDLLAEINSRSDFQPHYALFLAFLQIIHATTRKEMNAFTKNHLDFFYHRVLQLKFEDPINDRVHIIFELAKNVNECKIEKGTLLNAGKDATGKKLEYALEEEIIVNTAVISGMCSVYVDPSNPDAIRYAPVANSSDGLGGDLNKDQPKWKAFGDINDESGNNALPYAQIGFALAAQILELKEGNREITVHINFIDSSFKIPANELLTDAFVIYFTGEKEWFTAQQSKVTPKFTDKGSGKFQLELFIQITKDDPAITGFDSSIHSGAFITSFPVMQVQLNNSNGTSLYSELRNARINSASIEINVSEVTSLTLENDQGVIDAKKPFMPFGAMPVGGSTLYIGYDEIMKKEVTNFFFTVQWHDAPAEFGTYYNGYGTQDTDLTNDDFKVTLITNTEEPRSDIRIFRNTATEEIDIPQQEGETESVPRPSSVYKTYYRSEREFFSSPNYARYIVPLYKKPVSVPRASAANVTQAKSTSQAREDMFCALELNRSFLHKEYPVILAIEMKKDSPTQLNSPYTPTIKSIKLTYTAKATTDHFDSPTFEEFNSKDISFFHLHPYGVSEEHAYLFSKLDFSFDKTIYLLPQYSNEGEFYFSLQKTEPLRTVSILFQLAEGSADPQLEKASIEWSILSSNQWRILDSNYLLSDDTDHLLKSGIIKFYLPESATNDNTKMTSGNYWVRAVIKSGTPAACEFIALHPQASAAQFRNNDNDTTHLLNGLGSGTITGLSVKNALMKKVTQPYGSFGGRPEENETSFYIRVSERLRHKQRAVTIWDYEHLVLQQFPSIYRVKCMSHTRKENNNESCSGEMSPGNVTLVVIPDIKNKNAVNPLQPMASAETLSAIQQFVQSLCSFFVTPHIQNPQYEEVFLKFKVRFKKNYEFGYYSKVLNQAIVQFLSPWAFNSDAEITFGGKLSKSMLLNFIDELSYVDFVTEMEMYHRIAAGAASKEENEIRASSETAILVSSSSHLIENLDESNSCA